MARVNPGRPADNEYGSYYGHYIDLVPDGDILDILSRQLEGTERLLAAYTDAQAAWRPAPGEWNAAEIVGHLSDAERVFSYRALCFARADPTPLPGMDPDGFMREANFADRPFADIAAEFLAGRRATLAMLRGLDAAAWDRGGTADGTPVSVRALAYITAGHELHHLADLEQYPALSDQAAASA
jgi:DinB superfamily